MRIVEKLLYGIGGLIALVLLFILLCHFNPSLATLMGNTLYAKDNNLPDSVTVTSDGYSVPEDNGLAKMNSTPSKYIVPTEKEQKIPESVYGLNGYSPYVGKGSGVSQERSEEIETELTVGETGDDLAFDQKFYPYYYMLNDTGKSLYRQIFANAEALNTTFKPVVPATGSLLHTVFSAVCNDHPELFWLETNFKYMYGPTGKVARMDLVFNSTKADLETSKSKFESKAMEIVYMTRVKTDLYEIEKIAHDELISRVVYDLKAPLNQSAYSALVLGRTVCAGYARAYQYVMQKAGIPCYYCVGYAGGNHAWNIVKLGDDYYNVDSTWDDTDPNTKDYFNCTDTEFAPTHVRRELSIYLPACNGTKYGSELRAKQEEEAKEKEKEKTDKNTKDDKTTDEKDSDSSTQNKKYTISDYGFTEEDVITNKKDYYLNCCETLVDSKKKTVTFRNIILDKELWEDIEEDYNDGDYEAAYMDRILAEKHYNRCNLKVTAYPLDDGYYMIEHTVTFK